MFHKLFVMRLMHFSSNEIRNAYSFYDFISICAGVILMNFRIYGKKLVTFLEKLSIHVNTKIYPLNSYTENYFLKGPIDFQH